MHALHDTHAAIAAIGQACAVLRAELHDDTPVLV